MMCIYLRTNLINGKQYVGQANDYERREYEWKHAKHYAGQLINRARDKYKIDNFKTEILKECGTQDELNQWEQYYIKELNTKYPNGYNLTDGGGGISGFKHSEETKKKISEIQIGKESPMKGKHHTEEAKKKLSESLKGRIVWNKGLKGAQVAWNKGKHHTEEARKKMSEALKGKHHSEEWKNKISVSLKGKTPKSAIPPKKVYQYTLDGELIKVWNSTHECAIDGFKNQNISACCRGKLKQYKGYKWSYQPL